MTEIETMYPKIYQSVFDDLDPFQLPTIVYLGFKDGNFAGFMSGYIHNSITFYLIYTGMVRHNRGYGTLEVFRAGLEEIDKEFPFIMAVIKNDNIVALKMAMNEGFFIHGIRQDTAKNLFVELIRRNDYGRTTGINRTS